MLCFVMALKSKLVSKNWQKVSEVFENSLRSAYSQIDPNFKVIVVCHEIPILTDQYDERVEFIQVNFPPPTELVTQKTMADKWRKLAVGMVRVGEINPDFVMIMDADDLVSNQLSQYVNAHKSANGWMLRRGYTYSHNSPWIYKNNHFTCGSDAIVGSRLIQFPKDLEPKSIDNCVVLKWGHTIIGEKLKEAGTPLETLPFRGAIYVCDHGDNDSALDVRPSQKRWPSPRYLLAKLKQTQFLSRTIKEEFSIV
jgi:hypothetical protein